MTGPPQAKAPAPLAGGARGEAHRRTDGLKHSDLRAFAQPALSGA
jgi:hypothetical protein